MVYGVMNSMNARYFDVDNYLITAKDIRGPWSEPVYLHSSGFDASIFHDDNGKKYIVSLEWETRLGYEKPGSICMVEYDPVKKEIVGYPKRMWRGGTDRGCIEAPHLTKRGEYYSLCALRAARAITTASPWAAVPRSGVPMSEIPKIPL